MFLKLKGDAYGPIWVNIAAIAGVCYVPGTDEDSVMRVLLNTTSGALTIIAREDMERIEKAMALLPFPPKVQAQVPIPPHLLRPGR